MWGVWWPIGAIGASRSGHLTAATQTWSADTKPCRSTPEPRHGVAKPHRAVGIPHRGVPEPCQAVSEPHRAAPEGNAFTKL